MKIAYLCGARIPSTAANSVQTVRMCDAFAELGHEVRLYARHGDEAAPDLVRRFAVAHPFDLVSLQPAGPRGLRTASFVWRIRRAVARWRPDLIFARDTWLSAACVRLGAPLVFDAHHVAPRGSWRDRAFAWLIRQPNFAGITCITEALKQIHLDRYPTLRDADVAVLPNGAGDLTDGTTSDRTPGARLRVGYVGHLYRGRGVEAILAAAAALPTLDFHFVGGRPEDLAQWRKSGLPGNVVLHGYVEHARLPEHYRGFDILVAPYASQVFDAEGKDSAAFASPMKLFEYMATGLPIVTTAIPGVLEVVRDEETALIPAPDDINGFVGALARLERSAELRMRLGNAARAAHREHHTWQARARAVLGFASLAR